MIRVFLAACLCALVSSCSPAFAGRFAPECNITMPCIGAPAAHAAAERPVSRREARRIARGARLVAATRMGEVVPDPAPRARRAFLRGEGTTVGGFAGGAVSEVRQVLGGRPPGCPRAFCGCGASLHLFGRIIPALNLAANWLRFPRAAPAPDMAAARRGHVFVLKQHLGGNTWLVFDANSGGGKTRLHARSIAGFTVVNPHGSV